jgi:hypothetical protein
MRPVSSQRPPLRGAAHMENQMQNIANQSAKADTNTPFTRERLALAYLLNGLKELGFGRDEPINGGDAVEALAQMYAEVTENLLKGDAPTLPRIVVDLDGGLVQNVYADFPAQYLVYDFDVDGASPDEIAIVPDLHMDAHLGGTEQVWHNVGPMDAICEPEKVAKAFEAAEARNVEVEGL